MKSLSTAEIRRTFLDFFKDRGHTEIASSPLVPANDPTLLFTNAGMVQFKDVFTGKDRRDYVRAASSQKCVRAGGKHNDLENVGYTARHHTFFEMLGNFSFGDYFKKEAIEYAWELITKVFALPEDRLCVTVFAGEDGIPADDEAAQLWQSAGVSPERILRLGKKDNYWQMGDTGPQGPCSEIHYFLPEDTTDMFAPGRVEESDGWVEIWNLVFMQFVREAVDGELLPLPAPSVDTGAGLERLAMVMGETPSNYETDAFTPIIEGIAQDVGKSYNPGPSEDNVSMRVIADHARATTFLVSDGVMPSNEGRGYVLRRIMRRAIRHGKRLGFEEVFFHRACQRVIDVMKAHYPDLEKAAALVQKVAENEETAFRRTLDRGLKLLMDEVDRVETKSLAPEFVADLYDTFGFPMNLTRVIAEEHEMSVDEEAAHEAVRVRQAKGGSGTLSHEKAVDKIWFELRDQVGPSNFVGYASDDAASRVLHVEAADSGRVMVLLENTPFYGESGGQVGDQGELSWATGLMRVEDTVKPLPELIVHVGTVTRGDLEPGMEVRARVDSALRNDTRKNHSATHLLHLALKEVLGEHVQQKGSLVSPKRLRFDYAHFEPLSKKERALIEERVNGLVLDDASTQTEELGLEEAKLRGAVMLFGEKYAEKVRVVRIGNESLELCGGTHVHRSGEVGLFKIVSDSALASGVRRIEALTGYHALRWAQDQEGLLDTVAQELKVPPAEIPERVAKLLKKNKELERALDKARADAALGGSSQDPAEGAELIAGCKVLVHRADGTPRKSLRGLADKLRDRLGSGVVILTAKEGDKVAILVAATKDLSSRVHAGNVVKAATQAMEGSGGGRADFAQGGGMAAKLDAGLDEARRAIAGS